MSNEIVTAEPPRREAALRGPYELKVSTGLGYAESLRIAHLRDNFAKQQNKLKKQNEELAQKVAALDAERVKLIAESDEARSLCRAAHDRIVALEQRSADLVAQLHETDQKLKFERHLTRDLTWKLDDCCVEEGRAPQLAQPFCFCADLQKVCGQVHQKTLLDIVRKVWLKDVTETGVNTDPPDRQHRMTQC